MQQSQNLLNAHFWPWKFMYLYYNQPNDKQTITFYSKHIIKQTQIQTNLI